MRFNSIPVDIDDGFVSKGNWGELVLQVAKPMVTHRWLIWGDRAIYRMNNPDESAPYEDKEMTTAQALVMFNSYCGFEVEEKDVPHVVTLLGPMKDDFARMLEKLNRKGAKSTKDYFQC